MKICDKCSWYQYSEKSTKFFHGLEKQNAICGTIKTLINDGKKITMPHKMNLFLKSFYKNFIKNIQKLYIKNLFLILKIFKVRYNYLLLAMKNTPNMKLMLPKIISF